MGSIANCTLSKRAEFLENISVAKSLKDSLLKSPLSDKMFGLLVRRVQEELSKNPPLVKFNVQVNNGKRSVNATSSSTSTSASGGPSSSAKKGKNNYGKPQNKSHNSGKSSEIETVNVRSAETDTVVENGTLKLQENNAHFSNIYFDQVDLEDLNKVTKLSEISEPRLFEIMKTNGTDTTMSTRNDNPEHSAESDEYEK
ncbi:unnamed protein product [Mytilus coruscus]|uniref:Uncharacterized protein n=1 Tax=Mytilus coruscus TaxID=42192 RepID=A0A6J8CJD9_MYTCO|nr:unnamed protein product [Mytilus coruscus]